MEEKNDLEVKNFHFFIWWIYYFQHNRSLVVSTNYYFDEYFLG